MALSSFGAGARNGQGGVKARAVCVSICPSDNDAAPLIDMKIYISATYQDLREHRQAVANALRRMGHQIIAMEDYVSEGVRPLARF
jgi:hypothetical protein